MQILVDKQTVKNVLIITPKKDDDGKILYFNINIKDDFTFDDYPNIIPDQTVIEDGMWYKYTSEYGKRYAQLLCKDDCLVILYELIEEKDGNERNILTVHYNTYNNPVSNNLDSIYYIFWKNKDAIYKTEFIEFIKYYLQKYPKYYSNFLKSQGRKVETIDYVLYELSREYYENRNKTEQTTKYGYGFYELNTIFLELFPEIMSEENYNAYYEIQVYNKTYVPKEYYHIDDKLKEDLRNENND